MLTDARKVLDIEVKAIKDVSKRIGRNFEAVVRLILSCKGRVIVTGMGWYRNYKTDVSDGQA